MNANKISALLDGSHMIRSRSLFRSKSLSLLIGNQCVFLGSQLFALYWLYFNKGLIFWSMCTYISIYLFQIYKMPWPARRLQELVLFKRLFCSIQELLVLKSTDFKASVVIRLRPSMIAVSISFCSCFPLFGIELAYSHNLLFRLFLGLMSIHPVFVLINLCRSKVLYIHSFYYEYSYLSIFGKQSTNANGHHLL